MNDERKKRLGERVRRARREAEMTQGDLAEQLGVSQGVISNVETGVSTIDAPELPRWAAALKKPVVFFYLDLDPEANRYVYIGEENDESHNHTSPEVNEITFRAMQLSAEGQRNLLTVLRWIEAAEQNPREGAMPPIELQRGTSED